MKTNKKKIPARTISGRENQIFSKAMDLIEQKLDDGTASSQILATILRYATTKAQLEQEKMRAEIEVSKAKVLQLESQERLQETYEEAIAAMRRYSGSDLDEEEECDDEYYD